MIARAPARAAVLAAAAALAVPLAACDDERVRREPLPDWSAGYADADAAVRPHEPDAPQAPELQFGTHDDVFDGDFALAVRHGAEYPIRIRELGRDAVPCSVPPGEVGGPAQAIDCVLDMNELDLLVLGAAFDVVVPEACEYLQYRLSMYENYPVGAGPDVVSWTVQPDGTRTDQVNAADGRAICDYDYSRLAPGSPNCCLGTYEQRITHAATGDVSVSRHAWGGRVCDCYDGMAFLDETAELTEEGCPFGRYVTAGQADFVHSIATRGLSAYYASTAPLANYHDPAEHGGGPPAAFAGELAVPESEFYCLDHAEEIRARIRLVVREWNEEAEFDADRNPDSQGEEPGWDTPVDDFPDFAELTPGDDTWPMLPRPEL